MRKFGLSAATALTRVHDQRPIVSPNRAFLEALLDWEVRCAPNRDAAAPKLDHAAALAELRGIVEFEGEGGCC